MQFNSVLGQQNLKDYLIRQFEQQRLPHALLLWGDEGVGKLALAIALAQYISCSQRNGQDACGTCPQCLQYQKLVHPDLHFVFPFAKQKTGTTETCDEHIDRWREAVLANPYLSMDQWMATQTDNKKEGTIYSNESERILRILQLKSFSGGYKIMIIWQADRMQEACANKLLKILEEPPERTLFILITEHPEQLLPTILSRTQQIHVPHIADSDLESQFSAEIIHLAQGSMLKAQALQQGKQEESNPYLAQYAAFLEAIQTRQLARIRQLSTNWSDQGREWGKHLLTEAQRLTRECFIANMQQADLNYLNPSEQNFANRFCTAFNEFNIERISNELDLAAAQLEQNVSAKILYFDLALQFMTQIKKL